MANDNNQQNNTQQNTKADGDILSQLAANQATTKDVYTLEKGMNTTLGKIEKNQTKANTVFVDIQKEIKKGSKVISSVDTKLQQILTKINNIAAANSAKPTYNATSDIANTSVNYTDTLNDLRDLLINLNDSITSVNYSDALNDIQTLLVNINDNVTSVIPTDYSNTLTDISNAVTQIASQSMTGVSTNTPSVNPTTLGLDLSNLEASVVNILSAMSDTNHHLNEIYTNVLDIASYVNDCSSYLDEIRELLKNIDDRGASSLSVSAPGGSPTDVDSFADVNDTLLSILNAIVYGNAQRFMYSEQSNQHAEREKAERDDIREDLASLIGLTQDQLQTLNDLEKFNEARAKAEAAEKEIDNLVGQLSNPDTESTLSSGARDAVDGLLSNVFKGYDALSSETLKNLTGVADKWGTGEYLTKDIVSGLGGALGDVAGGAVSTALNAVVPGLGSIVGAAVDKAVTKGFESLGEWLSYFANHARETRDALIKASLDKIKKDVSDMATYSITIQENALDKIYNAWDQNLSTINATQGYTKEALNTLQDSVAQRLEREGYGNVINAADYATQLANTLNSKLGGDLAEAFAAQNLILQKAVPELDLSTMAADFAAIYTNAEKQGSSGETEMIRAMNQIAGATKALEEVTGGNNQFITQVGTFLKKAEEVVIRSGGTTDQIIELTTQMMAAEAPLAALTPQLSGFTNTIIDALMNSNEGTAIALRAITHDIDNTIGVSMTDFTNSFMRDTQGTLTAVYQAIDTFINTNANEGARQEFLQAMQSVFGLQASQIAQIDFGDIADQIASASLTTNAKALTAAENLVKSGETTTWEDQLVNNTTNQLLATNAVRDTLDNKLMRKLEKNELELERTVYALESTQTVDFAEKTMAFLTNIADIITGLLDPLGLVSGLTSMADVWNSFEIDKASYELVTTASSIGSTVTTAVDDLNADLRTHANTWGNAQNLAVQAMTKPLTDITSVLSPGAIIAQVTSNTGFRQGQAEAAVNVLQNSGVTATFDELMTRHTETTIDAEQAIAEAQAAEMRNQSMELQAQRMQQAAAEERQAKAEANQTAFDTRRMEALQQQRAQQAAEAAMVTANHDNIEAIRESVSKLDELSNYLSPILDENRNQSGLLQSLADKFDQLMHTLANRAAQPTTTSPTPNVNTSYNERDRIYGPIKAW